MNSKFFRTSVKAPMRAQGFLDWPILEILLTHVIDVLKLASKMYPTESKSETEFGEQALVRFNKLFSP